MKMSLRSRLFGIPLILISVCVLSSAGFTIWNVNRMIEREIGKVSESQEEAAHKAVATIERKALTVAARERALSGMVSSPPGINRTVRITINPKKITR